ncbi:MAG: hypothetical protein JWN86_778 [Planctomycetota bacterium]|nr:hypothetical protein [Planctomycetota bacterium]
MSTRGCGTINPVLEFERCEDRTLTALVFVLNGIAFSPVGPGALTDSAAKVLEQAGNRVIQLTTPEMATAGAFRGVARKIAALSQGQPIGLVGFSAGGSPATRLAGVGVLHVTAVLGYFGPPDLEDFFHFHRDDRFSRHVLSHVPFTAAATDQLSGPSDTSADVVTAFGVRDHNVTAPESAASFYRDFRQGEVNYYTGPHGVSINPSRPALAHSLAHL